MLHSVTSAGKASLDGGDGDIFILLYLFILFSGGGDSVESRILSALLLYICYVYGRSVVGWFVYIGLRITL